ncbi:hypothetical protein JCM11641_000393 [Rhodosporidiobolus odoratus]
MPVDRYKHTRLLLGAELFDKVQNANLLIVGAGGIGCELIKNLVMTGYATGPTGKLTLLDLDTIDLSNLNRQFLFQKQHVKRPKAVVAKETAEKFNPDVKIEALHRNIKDANFSISYFQQFNLVLNALDNLDARRHVNRMCLAAGVPLVESGTSGYVGQVQPIFQDKVGGKGEVECFDCTGKPVPKTFAVCTIRSTPSTTQHCIAWAKSYLFPQLFGADDEAEDEKELDEAEKNGENSGEIANLRAENKAVRELRATLSVDAEGAAKRVFDKVYNADINRLLAMTDMWTHRRPPIPLSWEELSKAPSGSNPASASALTPAAASADNESGNVAKKEAEKKEEARIKDQRKLTTRDSWELFGDAVTRLCRRVAANPAEPLSFDKDDDDTLDFVVGAANLRAEAFGIDSMTRWGVKEYAGNIIPAIATTNAIVAAALVQQSLHLLRGTSLTSIAKNIWLKRNRQRIFDVSTLGEPNSHCAVCRVVYAPVRIKEDLKLGEFVEDLLTGDGKKVDFGDSEGVSVQEGTRLVYESEDFEDNKEKTLKELEMGMGKFVTVTDMDGEKWPVVFCIGEYLPSSATSRTELVPRADGSPSIPSPIPSRPPPPPAPSASSPSAIPAINGAKDDHDDDLEILVATDLSNQVAVGPEAGAPGAKVTGKKRTAEEAELGGKGEGEGEGEEGKKSKKAEQEGEEEVIVID